MTGPEGTTVSDPQAGVHTGSGDQYNYTWILTATEELVRAGAKRSTIVREHRRRLVRCFIPPRRYGRAVERLENPGTVVLLDGPPGLGRRTAATMLLEQAPGPKDRIEELSVAAGDDFTGSADRYLMDLSGVTDADYPAAQSTLMRYRSVVEEKQARMAVVLPAGLGWMLHTDLSPLVVSLERPRGRAVLSSHLRVHGVGFSPEHLDTEELRQMFATAPMHDLARLAELVVQARDSRSYGTSFISWRDEAVAALTDCAEQAAGQVRVHRSAEKRALLFSAAMTSGAVAEVAERGADLLLKILRYEPEDTLRLAQSDLGEQLEELSIERDGTGRIAFRRLAYDNSVRRHFWENFPGLRSAFRDWMKRCVELPGLGAEDRMHLISRFAEQALSVGRPEDLCDLVEEWTRRPGKRFHAEAAALLELGLSHERYGARFRARVYAWVTNQISPGLARVLTDVCRQVIGVTHPEQAAVRLRHLAFRQERNVARSAREALLDLARGNGRVFRRLADFLAGRPSTETGRFLLELLDPEEMRVAPPWKEFTLAWRAMSATNTTADWTPVLRRWLDLSARGIADSRFMYAVLLATVGDDVQLNRLYAAVCEWGVLPSAEMTDEVRERLTERFCWEIDRALGLDGGPVRVGGRTTGESS
ncbi:hypothetical protein [Streptomyces acidiscabies]|uniref:hypothetical protein n=1 Tax=Streptomyces acidiscabies TaxID=42234 RepID=UPI0038F7F3C4